MAITDSANTITTLQVASEYNSSASNLSRVPLSTDGIFGNDNSKLELATITYDVSTRYIVLLTVRIDTNIKATVKSVSGHAGIYPYDPNLTGWHALITITAILLVSEPRAFRSHPQRRPVNTHSQVQGGQRYDHVPHRAQFRTSNHSQAHRVLKPQARQVHGWAIGFRGTYRSAGKETC